MDAEKSSTQVLDAATDEQAEAQQKETPNVEEEEAEEATESQVDLPSEENDKDEEMPEVISEKAEVLDQAKDKKSKKKQHPEGNILLN